MSVVGLPDGRPRRNTNTGCDRLCCPSAPALSIVAVAVGPKSRRGKHTVLCILCMLYQVEEK